MKKNNIKINNISKKVIAVGLTFTLAPVTFAGKTNNVNQTNLNVGTTLQNVFNFYEVVNKKTGERYHTILSVDELGNYYDILTKEKITDKDFTIYYLGETKDYLITYKKKEEEYIPKEKEEAISKSKKQNVKLLKKVNNKIIKTNRI